MSGTHRLGDVEDHVGRLCPGPRGRGRSTPGNGTSRVGGRRYGNPRVEKAEPPEGSVEVGTQHCVDFKNKH